MQTIKSAENFVIEQSADTGDISVSAQSRIKKDIELMSNTLQRNRERIAELEQKLRNSNANSAALRKSIELLKAQIAEKDALIVELQESLAARDVRINELDQAVSNLSTQVTDLTNVAQNQASVIATQDVALNEVYYIYAYTEQLRENNIFTGGGLFSKTQVLKDNFNRDAFTKADMRKLSSIFLESKKVKVCTNHPADSYELVQDAEGFYTLNILNADNFWSLTRYLVVELK
jgi:vacuolar-type H+-ATPase subunit I/STV1